MGQQTRVIAPEDPAYAGQKEYTPWFLRIYDWLVLGFFGPVVWRCPTARLVEHYRRHIRRRHLGVGPGTGFFLERARLPAEAQVVMLDPNPNVLAHAARRLARLSPSVIEADVVVPLADDRRFDSAAMNYRGGWRCARRRGLARGRDPLAPYSLRSSDPSSPARVSKLPRPDS